jgi:hypothetical protein
MTLVRTALEIVDPSTAVGMTTSQMWFSGSDVKPGIR